MSLPQGESVADVMDRIENAVVKLIAKTGPDPLVIVLRPVVMDLLDRWLTMAGCDPAGTMRAAPPMTSKDARRQIRRFELDEPTWRSPKALRPKKRISA